MASKTLPFYNGMDWVNVTPTEIDSTMMYFPDLASVRAPRFVVGQKVESMSGGIWMPGDVIRVNFTPVQVGRTCAYTWTFDINFERGGSARRHTEDVREVG